MRRTTTNAFWVSHAIGILVLALLVGLAPTAFADDAPVDTKRIEIWARGDDKSELDTTDVTGQALERLHKRMADEGYRLVETRELRAYADGRIDAKIRKTSSGTRITFPVLSDRPLPFDFGEDDDTADDDTADDDTADDDAAGDEDSTESAVRRDLRELLRGGGRLPDGFVPHGTDAPDDSLPAWWRFGSHGDAPPPPGFGPGPTVSDAMVESMAKGLMKASGTVLLRYLDAKDDPVKAPIYAAVLKDLGEALVAASEGDTAAGLAGLGLRLMPEMLAGLADPERAPVYEELMAIFTESMVRVGPPPPAPVVAPDAWPRRDVDRSLTLGGATISMGARSATVLSVPEDSVAHRMTLAPGDQILSVDGKQADAAGLRAVQQRISKGGQLTLRVRRSTGETEVLELEFAREDER